MNIFLVQKSEESKLELLKVKTIEEMKTLISQNFGNIKLNSEKISIDKALGRILSSGIVSKTNVPHFDRSVVDGYAVKLTDVQGASTGIPGFLSIVGKVKMGKETTLFLNQGETVYVPTGGMVPNGTEAMIMIEYTEKLGEKDLAIYKNAGVNENMMLIGDDIKIGDQLFEKGHLLRPQDIGVFSALGCLEIEVYSIPKIAIITTGNEIIPPEEKPKLGQIVDINTPALKALTVNLGANVVYTAYATDDLENIKNTVEEALRVSDIVILSGGSSMGEKDYTHAVIEKLGNVILHGLAIKPGKPTILGNVGGKPVVGLPGQPVSAIMVYMVIIKEFMKIFYGKDLFKYRSIKGKLMENIHASPGRRTFQTVLIKEAEGNVQVYPTHGKSGMITLLSYSDGYIEITENEEGKSIGDIVEIILF